MTVADDILSLLRENPEGLTDGELATRLGKTHQHINQTCRRLAAEGRLRRDDSSGVTRNVLAAVSASHQQPTRRRAPATSAARDDKLEGNVQSAIVAHLAGEGWTILRVADTESRERGIDIVAQRDGRRLLVEVKGYPGTTYVSGPNAGQPKPTQPSLQGGHLLAGALLQAMRMRGQHPDAQVAIGLPDVPRYRTLLAEIAGSLAALDLLVLLAHDDRTVSVWRNEHAPA